MENRALLVVEVFAGLPLVVEVQRNDLLEQVELLGDQAAMAKEQRKKGQIKPIIDSLANVCAGAGGLAVVWQTWGPVIIKFFGM